MLKAIALRKEYATVLAVDGVSFEVQRGQILGLIGPNGAGKTTSIRMVLNILQPDAGTVLYDGRPFTDSVRGVVGYLPEERGLYKKSRLIDTILYFARLRGMETGPARAGAYLWLQRFGLLDQKDRRVEELSKGNQQKVQFITAVIHDPALVILDEPFSGLDPVNQQVFKDVFLELREKKKAVIFSTHQMDQAERLSDIICLINRGRVVLEGTIPAVKKRYGTNSVILEFTGDGAYLQSLPGVRSALLYQNSAELELEPDMATGPILNAALGRLTIRRFELQEPSLHSIFLRIVGGERTGQVPA